MQEGMLFHYLKEPNSGVDIEQIVIHLRESIFPDRLRAAWELLVSRHEILRTRFVWDRSGQPNQEVLSDVSLPFQLEKITGLDDDERRKTLQAFLDSDRVHRFDMNCAPMLRITLFQWRETEFSLVWTFHHALLDGRSYPALLREVFENYEELASDRVPARIAPQSYRRHIEWITNRDFAEADGFWKQLLSGVTSLTPIVVENLELCAESVSRQGEAWNALDAATTRKLRRIAESNDLSLNSIVMGLWAILLRRYSGESTVVFGATRACRKSSVEGSDETVGLFINTVPVRAEISDEESALSTIGKVRKQWVEMRPYEHTPLARIKSVSQMPPGLPLFETLVVFENHRLDAVMNSLGGAWAHRVVELHELTNFPITLAAYDGDSLSFKIEFDRRRLGEDTVKRMLGHLKCLLDGVAQDPMTCVRDLRIQTDAERRELIVDFNTPAQRPRSDQLPLDGSATLHELFEAQVARRPQAVALTCEGQSLTYAEANARANQLADLLVERGVTRGKLVGLCLERNNDLVIAILAILKAGGAYLPIDLAYPAERLAFMLEDAQAPILITQKSLLSNLPSVPVEIICVDDVFSESVVPRAAWNLKSASGPDDIAYVIFTSGTTGKPKG